MKAVIITDTHFGARNDSQHFDAYFRKFYEEVFFPYLDKTQIKTILHLGDVFDRRKYINFNTLRSCKEYFFEELKKRNIDVKVIPGNHDTYYKNTNEVNSLDLLLREYSNIEIIENPVATKLGGREVSFIPWMCSDNYDACMNVIQQSGDVCFGHFEISGFDMFRGAKNDGGMDRKLLKEYSMVLTGHFHHRSTDDNIYYLGSPYGFTWSDYDDKRGFHVLDFDTLNLEFIENPFEIFHKIYYDDREKTIDASNYKKSCVKVIVVHKNDYQKFDKLLDALYINEVIELTIHEDFSEFESEALDGDTVNIEDTMTLLSEYVDSVESAKDKTRLKTLLKTLYVEAQNLEI
jgi:DNA repair exonuclease SbcCD nuclease subunit